MISSRYELRCHEDVIFGLLEYWCPETNTLVFPWGEATITLEDIASLVGLPVLREPVTKPLAGDSVKIEEETRKQYRKEMCRSKLKKARHGS
ncbi:hypothetical protein NC653_004305 [Populus alba x Populus x berolinensis]|uniref:Aminotransferase-like plant mobile domain-containing protein n=1 Tax=Populus alba x Populus x berolinensis TaxID=444605 RepID=A0AAD6RTP6_9ROSI|nr:hypothetical protein NC653_004305 [Populus alba x Populus x berolinensis]